MELVAVQSALGDIPIELVIGTVVYGTPKFTNNSNQKMRDLTNATICFYHLEVEE